MKYRQVIPCKGKSVLSIKPNFQPSNTYPQTIKHSNTMKKIFLATIISIGFSIAVNAQVKVGNNPTTITPSAVLDVESTNKGVIFPRVPLTSSTDVTTIASPATGLLVYNTGTGGLSPAGYYFWNGSSWARFDNSTSIGGGNSTNNASVEESAVMGPLGYINDPQIGYGLIATTPDGKYSIRVWDINNGIPGNTSIQIRPNTTIASLSWNWHSQWTGNNTFVQARNVGVFPANALGKWCGTSGANGDFTLQAATGYVNAWGDPGIADGAAIEHRRYTWTNTDSNDKTMYEATIMMGLFDNSLMNSTNCPSGNCTYTKAYIKITQVSSN